MTLGVVDFTFLCSYIHTIIYVPFAFIMVESALFFLWKSVVHERTRTGYIAQRFTHVRVEGTGVLMKAIMVLAVMATLIGCGPDKALLMDTKFDALLREKMTVLATSTEGEMLAVLGKCTATIDGAMRQALMNAGADIQTMSGSNFTAMVSSEDVFGVASLEFVTQMQLSQKTQQHVK